MRTVRRCIPSLLAPPVRSELAEEGGLAPQFRLILLALESDGPSSTSSLRDAADLDQNQQVIYRMETYLVPAALVSEVGADERDENEPRLWRLTDGGKRWLQEHREDVEGPQTLDEACETAAEAVDIAEQARSSAGSATATVADLEQRLDDALATLEAVEATVDERAQEQASTEITESISELRTEIIRACAQVVNERDDGEDSQDDTPDRERRPRNQQPTDDLPDDLDDAMEQLATAVEDNLQAQTGDALAELSEKCAMMVHDEVTELEQRIGETEAAVEDLNESVVTLAERTETVNKKADAALELQERGFLGRVRWLLLGQ